MTETLAPAVAGRVLGRRVSEFDLAHWETDAEALATAKAAADLRVSLRLARYTDDGRTAVAPTNAGRYRALHGGFLAFLTEEPDKAAGGSGTQRWRPCGGPTCHCG